MEGLVESLPESSRPVADVPLWQGRRGEISPPTAVAFFLATGYCVGMLEHENIVLIGMPAAGKSTVGVLLAKRAGRNFVDTDVVLQAGEGRNLQELLDEKGLTEFCRLEERYVLSLDVRGYVVATGGSVVYSDAAMSHLDEHGRVVFLESPLSQLQSRLGDTSQRGLVSPPGQDLAALYADRLPRYQRWAEITIDCRGRSQDDVVEAILTALE